MAARQTTFVNFGPDVALSSLPASIQACLPPNQPTPACDQRIGSAAEGPGGFCGTPPYSTMTYCACVNSAIPCPEYAAASCANSAFAYKPSTRYTPGPNGGPSIDERCSTVPICVNIVDINGNQNVASNIVQQCGVITNVTRVLQASPTLAALAFILIIAIIVVLMSRPSDEFADPGGLLKDVRPNTK